MKRTHITIWMACTLLCASLLTAGTTARHAAASPTASSVIATYFTIANGLLRGAGAESLATVFAPDAVLVAANPKGVVTTVHGITAITAWYKAWAASALPGTQLTTTSMRIPSPDTVIHYEIAGSPAKPLIARCAHIFVVRNGRIVSDDFIVFFHAA